MADKETIDLLKAWDFEDTFVQHFKCKYYYYYIKKTHFMQKSKINRYTIRYNILLQSFCKICFILLSVSVLYTHCYIQKNNVSNLIIISVME